MRQGKLIVIDGVDGAGKATQTKLLVQRLKREGKKVATLDFPQYEKNLTGKLIGECLGGEHCDFVSLSPRIASVLYAVDRFETKKRIERWLRQGRIVILDRYVSANQLHQGGKIKNSKERKEFLLWLDQLEYGVFRLPRPHVTIFLNVPITISLELLKEKKAQDKKTYLKAKKDVHESNIQHLLDARQSAVSLLKKQKDWRSINCANRRGILSREVIHERVYDVVRSVI